MDRALKSGLVDFETLQIRAFSEDKHRKVDDTPYGGGPGMLLRADVLYRAWEAARSKVGDAPVRTVLLSPQGPKLTHATAERLAQIPNLILICGHYEGVDERFIEAAVDEQVSIGDYVVSNGELPALILADAVARAIPGFTGNSESFSRDSLADGFLKYPQYTKPRQFRDRAVPEILLSGDHGAIEKWRREESRKRTVERRPDLLAKDLRK